MLKWCFCLCRCLIYCRKGFSYKETRYICC